MNWDGEPPLVYSAHARTEMRKRQITELDVESVVKDAGNTYPGHSGCTCVDRQIQGGRLRVVLDLSAAAPKVVSTYYLP
jgi:hypothetical protein